MGRYISWADIEGRYPEIKRGPNSTEVGSYFIQYAEAEVEGYLSNHFSVPFSSNNISAKDLCIDIAFTRLASGKSEKREDIRTRAYSLMDNLINGRSNMMTNSGEAMSSGDVIWSNHEDYYPVFGAGDPMTFSVSSERLADEEADRL